MAHRLSCSVAYGIFLDQESNPCLLYWQADSLPLGQQESPRWYIVAILSLFFYSKKPKHFWVRAWGSPPLQLPQLKPRSYTYTHRGKPGLGCSHQYWSHFPQEDLPKANHSIRDSPLESPRVNSLSTLPKKPSPIYTPSLLSITASLSGLGTFICTICGIKI